ncbi:hypothetical protein ACWZHB_08215 [Nocardia sp. FBN12]
MDVTVRRRLELAAVAWQRRGVELREQLAVLRERRMRAWDSAFRSPSSF